MFSKLQVNSILAKPYTKLSSIGIAGKLLGKSPKFPSSPGGPCGPGGPTTGSLSPPLPMISPKDVLGSPNSILSYLFFNTLNIVLITLACVLILYLVSIIVYV